MFILSYHCLNWVLSFVLLTLVGCWLKKRGLVFRWTGTGTSLGALGPARLEGAFSDKGASRALGRAGGRTVLDPVAQVGGDH